MEAALASPVAGKSDRVATMQTLLEFNKRGVFSLQEIRRLICKEFGMEVSDLECNSPSTPPLPKKNNFVQLAAPANKSAAAPANKSPAAPVKQSRKRKSPDATQQPKQPKQPKQTEFLPDGTPTPSSLRDLVRNTTRRRFIQQCSKLTSVLWQVTKGGKQTMNRLLFDSAFDDLVNILHQKHPFALRKVQEQQLKAAVRWQVMRDRNNWKGKEPKRRGGLFAGESLSFDFDGVAADIERKLQEAEDLTTEEEQPARYAKVARTIEFPPPAKIEIRKVEPNIVTVGNENIRTCMTCKIDVWTGDVADCPTAMQLAHPFGTNWCRNPQAQPYCQQHWKQEQALMKSMSQQHCAIGQRIKNRKVLDAISKAQSESIARAIANSTTPPPPPTKDKVTKGGKDNKGKGNKGKGKTKKKIQLGGVRVVEAPPVKRWQVCHYIRPLPSP